MSDRPRSSLALAEQLFQDAGLPQPPVPDGVPSQIQAVDDWCFATRDVSPMGMYLFDDYIIEALRGEAPEYLAFSHAGHGMNSYAINYHYVEGTLGLFAQAPWGGVYTDHDETVADLRGLFDRCARLIDLVQQATTLGLLNPPGRLVVCESAMRGIHAWGWLDVPLTNEEAVRAWLDKREHGSIEHESPTAAAAEWLRGLISSGDAPM